MSMNPPSVSDRQRRMMLKCSTNKAYAKKRGVPQSVAKKFVRADKKAAKHANGL
jgi:hypothetical protein